MTNNAARERDQRYAREIIDHANTCEDRVCLAIDCESATVEILARYRDEAREQVLGDVADERVEYIERTLKAEAENAHLREELK